MGKLFGTDGIRGIVGEDLTHELALKVGEASAYVLGEEFENITVLIGRDTRISGQMLASALSSGLMSQGANVIDLGVIPTPAVSYLVKKGIDRSKIKAIGIPINPITSSNFNIEKATKKYGFTGERPICLFFGGGGNGGTLSLPYIKGIIKSNLNIDFIYVAGKNQKAKEKVDKWISAYGIKNIKTLGFVNNVPELLQICDFVVSKPGGAQSTESLYFKKPIIMINHSGGQEVGNYKYFERNGYGKRFRTQFMFNLFMRRISENPSIIDKMRKNMSKNKKDLAAQATKLSG